LSFSYPAKSRFQFKLQHMAHGIVSSWM